MGRSKTSFSLDVMGITGAAARAARASGGRGTSALRMRCSTSEERPAWGRIVLEVGNREGDRTGHPPGA